MTPSFFILHLDMIWLQWGRHAAPTYGAKKYFSYSLYFLQQILRDLKFRGGKGELSNEE